jgi:hypothetical protein
MRRGLDVPVTLQARFFFMAYGAGLPIPTGLNTVGAALPSNRVVLWRNLRVTIVTEGLLIAVTHRAVSWVYL